MAKRNQAFTRWLSALLVAGMLAGMMPAAAWAQDADPATTAAQTEQATPETAEREVAVETDETPAKETADEAADEMADGATDDEQPDGETTLTVSADDFVTYSIGESTDETTLISEQKTSAGAAVQAAEPRVTAAQLSEKDGSVFGVGILTGAGDLFDTVSYDKTTGENRGCDSTADNDIVRSFDKVLYSVSTTLADLQPGVQNLVYTFTLPKNTELSMSALPEGTFAEQENGNMITYMYTLPFDPKNQTTGEINYDFAVNVGNKHQGETFCPKICVYPEGYAENGAEVQNVQEVMVTSAPAYNIVVGKNTGLDHSPYVVDFTEKGKLLENAQAAGYTDGKVPGYRQIYGFALEMAKTGRGIKGSEFPDLSKDITFDIDIGTYTVAGQDVTGEFAPILFEVNPNTQGRANVPEIPYTTDKNGELKGCYNSGAVTITQTNSTLHVTLKGGTIQIDPTKFPKKNDANQTYWEDVNKILHGVFAAWQFTVIYPYATPDGQKTLKTEFPNGGTINVGIKAEKMSVVSSADGQTVTAETNPDDNEAKNSWNITPNGSRNHSIIYSSRKEQTTGYTYNASGNDSDVAAAGAQDLAFTAQYSQNNVGGVFPENTPTEVEQLILFDRTAIQNVQFAQSNGAAEGYGTIEVLYARYKNGVHLDNESMRNANKDTDFEYTAEMPEGGCDGVLLRYTGSAAKSSMNLLTQFYATVAPTVQADKVYMITIVTDAKTADGYPDLQRIDNRSCYTVPDYDQGRYAPDAGSHQFSRDSADGLYIVPYTAKITKTVAQLTEQPDGTSAPRQLYKVSAGERYVDYCISSYLNYWADVTPPENGTTTVTLVDTLPAGMAYIENSARWGGVYTDAGTAKTPGTITGGEAIEPVVTQEKGQTVLTWTIEKVPLGRELPKLYYSCKLGDELYPDNDVKAGEPLTNYIGIHTTEDQRDFAEESENYTHATVTPTKDNAFFLSKEGSPWMELNDGGYYDLTITNTSGEAKENLCVVDTMPYDDDADAKLTQKGSYTLKSITLNHKAIRYATDFELWYTTAEAYKGKKALEVPESEVTAANGWTKLDYTTDGDNVVFTVPEGIWPTALVYKDAKLEQNTIARLHIEYNVTGARGDRLFNSLSTISNNTNMEDTAETRIVSRSLEGTVWYDKDQDGKIGEGEERLQDVKATLLRKNEKTGKWEEAELFVDPATRERYPSTVTTDKDGHYKFVGLPEGEYRVKFTDGRGNVLSQYDAETKYDESADGSKVKNDNDSVTKNRDNKVKSGTINDIEKAPTLDEIAGGQYSGGWEKTGDADYNMPNQNFGVIKNSDTPKEPDKPTNSPTPTPTVTPEPEKPGEPTPTAPTATPVVPTATPKPGEPNSPVTPAKPATPTTPAQSTATPSPAPTATPQAAKATATPAPAATTTSAIPQTGDSMPVALLLALAVLSLGSAVALTVVKRRKEK